MKSITAILLTMLLLTGCTAADLAINAADLTWCDVDEVGYRVEVDDYDISLALELVGVECEPE